MLLLQQSQIRNQSGGPAGALGGGLPHVAQEVIPLVRHSAA